MEKSVSTGDEILRKTRFILPKARGRRPYRIFIVNVNAILKSEVAALHFIHLFRVSDCDANSILPLILRL